MRRCQHFCGCEGNPVGRDPDTGLLLCAGCLGRSILGTDCSRARKYFGHMPAHFGDEPWAEPPPLRDGDRSPLPAEFEVFLTIRTGYNAPAWDFMPLAEDAALMGAGVAAAVGAGARAGGAGAEAEAGAGAGAGAGMATGAIRVRTGSGTATNPHRPPKDPPPGPLPPPPARPVQPNPPRR